MAKLDKLLQQAEEHLDAGETVEAAVLGWYEAKLGGQDSARRGALLATPTRVVFFAKKMMGYDLESFPYKNISSIEASKGFTGHKVSLFASGNRVDMKNITDGDAAKAVVDLVRQRSGGSSLSAPAAAGPDVADQIRKLGELRDQGLLTEDEFSAKKAQLLGL